MSDSPLASLPLVDQSGRKAPPDALKGKVVALYFSAHWCPPCRGFTPMLRTFHAALKAGGQPIEIIFVSSDKDQASFTEYFTQEHGDWLAVDFGAGQGQSLGKKYSVRGIPTLVVVNAKGEVVVAEARDDVASGKDPMAVFSEWKKVAGGSWQETPGTTLGGGSSVGDAAAMRAARLARLGGAAAPATAPVAAAVATAPVATPVGAPALAQAAAPAVPAVAAPALPGDELDPTAVAQLTSMGFPEERVREVLRQTEGNVDTAVMILVE